MTSFFNVKNWAVAAIALMSVQFSGPSASAQSYDPKFNVEAQSFADLQILRYQVPGFNELTLQQKKLSYYLYEAALSGRDIIYDQKSKHGILLRKTIEAMYGTYKGDKKTAPTGRNLKSTVAVYGSVMATTTTTATISSFPIVPTLTSAALLLTATSRSCLSSKARPPRHSCCA